MVSKVAGKKVLAPAWYKEPLSLPPFSVSVLNRILPLLPKLSSDPDGHCPGYSTTKKWHLVAGGQVDHSPAPGKSEVFNLLGNSNGSLVLQSDHQQSRVSFVYSEQRSVGEDVSKDSSPRRRGVTFTFPRTLDDPCLRELNWTVVENTHGFI
jgi:hypothetical protein